MKSASKLSGIVGRKVTNHSVRKTMIQRLVDSKFSTNEVAQLSGHKNLKSLDSYMKTSDQTQKEMSLSLSGNASDVQVVQQVVPERPRPNVNNKMESTTQLLVPSEHNTR